MRPGLVVERQIACYPLVRGLDGVVRVQIDLLVFEASPQPFHEHVVAPAPFAIHADLNAVLAQELCELLAGELAPLVGVEDFRAAILGNCQRSSNNPQVWSSNSPHLLTEGGE